MGVVQRTLWYMTDHRKPRKITSGSPEPDMKNLKKPRGKGYSLRMDTPAVLVGTHNPWTNEPFRKTISLGLNTRSHAEAIRLRDVRIGQIRQLEADAMASKGRRGIGRIIDLSPESAAEWRQMRAEASDPTEIDFVLTEHLERADEAGKSKEAQAFGKMVFRGALPLAHALEKYLEDRSEGNPYGFDTLATTTALDVRTAVKHLTKHIGTENPTLHDVDPDTAFKFRMEYLPLVAKVRPKTVAKHVTLLRGLWAWAIEDRKLLRNKKGHPIPNPWKVEERGTPRKKSSKRAADETRTAFKPDEVSKLLSGSPQWGSRQGDLLRLALATGCRADEIGSLKLMHVKTDASGFQIAKGKTDNARRFVPVVEAAQDLLAARMGLAEAAQADMRPEDRRLFPEWPLKPTTQKANSVSQWFTRYRRATLGTETDGKLAMHSFRHTWRTMARRGGVPEDRIYELGGWAAEANSASVYDHGLTEENLREAQQAVWEALRKAGYLEAF